MNRRPTSITILSGYLLVVFPISLIFSLYGAATEAAPYETGTWLILALSKVLATLAGIALWRMLRVGAYLWAAGIVLGWALAFTMNTGFFPNFGAAALVSLVIVGASAWALVKHWNSLRGIGEEENVEGAQNA
ncbi:MAG: hypothetical protein GC147_00920 [Porphyrobacter sp.]|nr:hypothetical protein [Porphyrobacter sp.]